MTSLFVSLRRNRMVCFGSSCLAGRRTELGKQPRQACRHSEMPLLATWAESLVFRSVLHTLPCQLPAGTPAAVATQGPASSGSVCPGRRVARGIWGQRSALSGGRGGMD